MSRGAGQDKLSFSVLFFASDSVTNDTDRYSLVRAATQFADANKFEAVWFPERHFHRFGGLFPNPSLLAAAAACWTRRIRIRAGSVIAPLHDPVRIAEEWSVADNLSQGRIELSFGAGWHADDFVLAPDAYATRHAIMLESISKVRELWEGHGARRTNGLGRTVSVRMHPPPVQKQLPIWVTASASPGTFEAAGTAGANVLTHLLHQDVADLGRKIELYRRARRGAGHTPMAGRVAVMLHTFLDRDASAARRLVREPLSDYLTASASLDVRAAADGGKLGGGLALGWDERAERQIHQAVRVAVKKYTHGALIGSPESCLPLLAQLASAGVNEIACLVDFGLGQDLVLASLGLVSSARAGAWSGLASHLAPG
jgi:natural product biosynthesis luciferase-like monooxygenase protein